MVMIKKIAAGSALAVSGALMFSIPAFAMTVTTADIANNAVTSAKIADYTIGSHDLGTASVGGRAISAGGVQTANLGSGVVTSAKLAMGAVTADKLQSAAADLGAANVTVNLGNTNGSYNTNVSTDGTITAGAGLTATTGGLTVTAGGATVTAGGLTVGNSTTTAVAAMFGSSSGAANSGVVHLASDQKTIPTVAQSVTGLTAVAVAGATDTRGVITTTGTPSAAGTITVTFNSAYTAAPVVVITPMNASGDAALAYVSSVTTAHFVITTTVTTPGATPSWSYMVMQ